MTALPCLVPSAFPAADRRPGLYSRPGAREDLDRAAQRQVEHHAQELAAFWRRHSYKNGGALQHGGVSDA